MGKSTRRKTWQNWPVIVLALLYLVVASLYNVIVPLWETPDETGHFDYAVHLLEQRTLPRMEAGRMDESFQPPLYYVLEALVISPADLDNPVGAPRTNPNWIFEGQGGRQINCCLHDASESTFPYQGYALALRLARALSTLLGLGTVLLTHRIARTILPNNRFVVLLATALVAFNPQFLSMSAAANNDNLVVFTTTGLLAQAVALLWRRDRRPPTARDGLVLGGWILVALMAKLTSLALIGVALAALLAKGARDQQLKPTVGSLALAISVAVVGSSWWWGRNQVLYGDPLGIKMYHRTHYALRRLTPLTEQLPEFFRTQFRSFWGVFGWMVVYAPRWYYVLFSIGCGAAVIGWIPRLLRTTLDKAQLGLCGFLLASAVAQQVQTILLALQGNESMWQGRFLLPALAPLAVLLACGITGWVSRRWERYLAWGGVLGLLGLAVYVPFGVIRPAYLPQLGADQVSISHPLQVTFGDQFLLRGYDLEQEPLAVTLTLYWESPRRPDFDYSVFVHLVDERGELIGQQDHAPGSDRNHPPTTWSPGEVVVDSHRILLLRSMKGPVQMRVGVYNWATGERLMAFVEGESVGDVITLKEGSG